MTGRVDPIASRARSDRALELYEKGLAPTFIAERLGVRPGHVQGLIQRARQRREREKAGEVVE